MRKRDAMSRQGENPFDSTGFIGTAEAVPCYKASNEEYSASCEVHALLRD
jgi:hypothetical protein